MDINPPRMSPWQKPFRAAARFLRRIGIFAPFAAIRIPAWLVLFSRVAFFGIILSLLPGLAHWIQRRFRSVRLWIAVWLIFLFLALFLFGGFLGYLMLGMALAAHVWIALHSSFLRGNNSFQVRIGVFLLTMILYYFIYLAAARILFYPIRGGVAMATVPSQRITIGDYLLGWRNPPEVPNYPRGCWVYAQLRQVQRNTLFRVQTHGGYVRIIGLPGEEVEIKEGCYYIDKKQLDPERYPVPQWIANLSISIRVPQDSYFISADYTGAGYNAQMAAQACIFSGNQIQAQAFLRWGPLGRRGFIRTDE
jgi:signal peptidase I